LTTSRLFTVAPAIRSGAGNYTALPFAVEPVGPYCRAAPEGSDRRMTLILEPQREDEPSDRRPRANADQVWLRAVSVDEFSRHRWIRLRYSASYFDDPVRPLIRFTTAKDRDFVHVMNGPVLGSGEWIGRVPNDTIAVAVSPRRLPAPFAFRLESIEPVRRQDLVRRGMRLDPFSLLQSFGAKLINAPEEQWSTLQFAATATPLGDYAAWYRRLHRPIELGGLDRPRADWRATPSIRLLMPLRHDGEQRLLATIASLREQIYGRWSLHALPCPDTPAGLLACFREQMGAEPRLHEAEDGAGLSALAPALDPRDAVAVIEAGATLPDYALAAVAERIAETADARIVYGDEDSIASDGRLHSPLFKPDWNAVWFETAPYLGRLTCISLAELQGLGVATLGDIVRSDQAILQRATRRQGGRGVVHLRRILYRRQAEPPLRAAVDASPPSPRTAAAGEAPDQWPEVTVVIPTRDRADLLSRCTEGLRNVTDYPRLQTVVVDNGTVEADALRLLGELEQRPGFQVLRRPGEFNFSSLCNDGAKATQTSMLVFLNNDIGIIAPGWLKALIRWAIRPEVGVVGAKLLFPDHSIEHAGVVLGHGGIAGHIYHGCSESEAGYLRQLQLCREVTAVTGACIAIQREKFEAVSGFNAKRLPVDLNDIDLCLKVAARGWKNIWTPEAVLYHQQSATRRFPLKPSQVYRRERRYFMRRWINEMRDDPQFHPALSLFSHRPALA
jgi:GT2 family glycosyltransferase